MHSVFKTYYHTTFRNASIISLCQISLAEGPRCVRHLQLGTDRTGSSFWVISRAICPPPADLHRPEAAIPVGGRQLKHANVKPIGSWYPSPQGAALVPLMDAFDLNYFSEISVEKMGNQ